MRKGRSQGWAPGQLTLPFDEQAMSELSWSAELCALLGCPVDVSFSRARSTPVTVDRTPHVAGSMRIEVRLHEMFAAAPTEVVSAMASWIRSGRRARRAAQLLDRWIDAALESLPPPRAKKAVAKGKHYDLQVVIEDLFEHEFAGEFSAIDDRPRITWGRGNKLAKYSLQLGSYDARHELVTIHPVLDRPQVPALFVRYLVFHELLHAVVPAEQSPRGRCLHHGMEFRRREREYHEFETAVAWQNAHLDELIAASRGT